MPRHLVISLSDLQPSASVQEINSIALMSALAEHEIVFVAPRDGPEAVQTDGIIHAAREEVDKQAQ